MKSITLYPTAKINIGLYVFEKRPDGFHEIESIFFPVGPQNSNLVADVLTVSICDAKAGEKQSCGENHLENPKAEGESKCGKVRMIESGLEYPGAPEDNICVKAYHLLDADFQLPPAVISLEKHLPIGAGLGGGSSDGVCTLKALNELCNLNLSDRQMMSYAAKLGSDCPFFVKNQPMLVTGRGEILTPLFDAETEADDTAANSVGKTLENLRENYFVEIVFSPDCFVSTKKAYSIVPKRKRTDNYTSPETLAAEPVEQWQDRIVNDFEAPVFKEFPKLQKVKDSLKQKGAAYVSMTGSGSAIYAFFKK